MATTNISLPDEMKAFLDEQVRTRRDMTASEYVRDVLRNEKDMAELRARTDANETANHCRAEAGLAVANRFIVAFDDALRFIDDFPAAGSPRQASDLGRSTSASGT